MDMQVSGSRYPAEADRNERLSKVLGPTKRPLERTTRSAKACEKASVIDRLRAVLGGLFSALNDAQGDDDSGYGTRLTRTIREGARILQKQRPLL
jgi:hypothetical protein